MKINSAGDGAAEYAISALSLVESQSFSGAEDGTANTYTMAFSNYSSVSQLDGVGFQAGSYGYVLILFLPMAAPLKKASLRVVRVMRI